MIAIIDYGAGNLRSVFNAFEAIGEKPYIASKPEELKKALAIILPGVGAFGDGIVNLKKLNFVDQLTEEVLVKKKPYLGICLGMQFLADVSMEMGVHSGLGFVNGAVRAISPNNSKFRIPHIGWNNVAVKNRNPLFEGLEDEPVFYFVNSFYFEPDESELDVISSTCWHGATITASIQKNNIFGVQFHPEKSQQAGLKLLENFIKNIT
jgi:glutamine amidotransferase